jgi:hypothetical protein
MKKVTLNEADNKAVQELYKKIDISRKAIADAEKGIQLHMLAVLEKTTGLKVGDMLQTNSGKTVVVRLAGATENDKGVACWRAISLRNKNAGRKGMKPDYTEGVKNRIIDDLSKWDVITELPKGKVEEKKEEKKATKKDAPKAKADKKVADKKETKAPAAKTEKKVADKKETKKPAPKPVVKKTAANTGTKTGKGKGNFSRAAIKK